MKTEINHSLRLWALAAGLAAALPPAASSSGPWSTSAPQTADAAGITLFHDLFPSPGKGFYRTLQQ